MDNLDKILNYLDGSLSESEKARFEAEMERNIELKEELSLMRLGRDAIRSACARETVEQIQTNFLENRKPEGKQVFFGRHFLKYAAVILTIFTFWGAFHVSKIDSASVLTDHSISYVEPVMRSTEAEQAEFKLNYQNKKFEAILKRIPEINDPTLEQYFLSSMAAFELKKYATAQKYLENVRGKDITGIYEHEIIYYEGLIALGQEQYSKAYELLSTVKNDPHNPYSLVVTRSLLIKVRYLRFFNTK